MWPLDSLPLPMLATKGSYRLLCLTGAVCVAALLVLSLSQSSQQFLPNSIVSALRPNPSSSSVSSSHESWTFEAQRDAYNYGLTSEQCDSAFPGLFTEVDNAVRRRQSNHITQKELTRDQWPAGTVRVLVWEQQIYVLDAVEPTLRRSRIYSTLHSLNRALMASTDSEMLPNIEFIFSIEDWSIDENLPIWAYDRKHADQNTWLIPDFGFYAWPEPGIGTYSEVRRRMRDVEDEIPSLAHKIQKLVWRGAVTPSVAPALRQHLIDKTSNQTWADVQVLVWSEGDDSKRHRLNIEDHCEYMFIQHTEGRAWSGRLKYVQNCVSVIVAHKMEWIQHYQHLLIPEGENQNFVQVERDFTDLPEKMEHLLAHPEEAERIAQNSARTFRDRYLTPAAEACYWRRLVRGWGQVSFAPEFYTGLGADRRWRGVPFESFAIMRKLEWEPS